MMYQPRVSIVIPTFNQRPEYLRASLNSALSQTYGNFEVVVSDNHSTNEVPSVLATYSDPRLRIIRPDKHLQLTEHFAFAMDAARGEFLSILSSDDWVAPDWLSSLMPLFDGHPEAVFGFGEIINVDHDNLDQANYLYRKGAMPTGVYLPEHMLPIMFGFDRNASWMIGDVIRASAYREAGGIGYGGLKYSSDWALAVRLLELGSAVYVNQPIARYRTWGRAEGKVDSSRFVASTSDIVEVYKMLEGSPKLQGALRQLQPRLVKAKRAKARLHTLMLLEALALGDVEEPTLGRVKELICKLDPSARRRWLMAACGLPLGSVLRLIYGPAMGAYRSDIGQWLMGRKQILAK